jgi:hypothetical protein
MVQVDNSDIKVLIHSLRTESVAYFRQWVVWLGVASGAGGMGLFSLAANLPDRNHAFHIFLPSLWVFFSELRRLDSACCLNRLALVGEASILSKLIIVKNSIKPLAKFQRCFLPLRSLQTRQMPNEIS